ncbi:MAG TPA: hypothetical protein VI756_31880 [Blastocatellia bacterium]
MRRILSTRETIEVGRCIYCGEVDGRLSEEHVTPFGLSGALVLLHASCQKCADITSRLEGGVLSRWFAARAALGTKTRRKKERLKARPMFIEKNGSLEKVLAFWQDQWKVIHLPIFPIPAYIDGRAYHGGIDQVSMDQFELSERVHDIAKRHSADRIVQAAQKPEDFARFIAKMAYGYAVARYTINAFEKVYVASAILGDSDDIGRWVGCSDRREFPVRECNVSVGFRIFEDRDFIVKIKMFPKFDGAEYVTVVGKLKELYANYFHSLGHQG